MRDRELLERIRQLEDRLAALEDPQALAAKLELAWQPRGTADVPRALNASGNTIGRATPRFRFSGGATYNPTDNVIEVAGSPPTSPTPIERVYATAGSPADCKIQWLNPGAPFNPVAHIVARDGLDNGAMGRGIALEGPDGTSIGTGSADGAAPNKPVVAAGWQAVTGAGYVVMRAPAAVGQPNGSVVAAIGRQALVLAVPGAGAGTGANARSEVGTVGRLTSVITTTQPTAGQFTTEWRLANSVHAATACTLAVRSSNATTSVAVERAALTYVLLNQALASNWMRTQPSSSSAGPTAQVMRGPFTAAVAALAGGATTVVNVPNCRVGTDYTAMGSFVGAAGSEELLWSSAVGAGSSIDVSVTNVGAGPLTADLRLYVVSGV